MLECLPSTPISGNHFKSIYRILMILKVINLTYGWSSVIVGKYDTEEKSTGTTWYETDGSEAASHEKIA